MNEKSQNYKVEVLDNYGRPIVLRPDLSMENATYWANRIHCLGNSAYITMAKLTERNTDTTGPKAIEWTE